MCTARSLSISFSICHTCPPPLPCMPPAMHSSPATHTPLPSMPPITHAPCHAYAMPCMPPCHACPPAMHVPPPAMHAPDMHASHHAHPLPHTHPRHTWPPTMHPPHHTCSLPHTTPYHALPSLDRILDTRFWKYNHVSTSLRAVIMNFWSNFDLIYLLVKITRLLIKNLHLHKVI